MQCPSRVRSVPLNDSHCGRYLFVEGWSDFFARSGSSSDPFAHDRQPSPTPCYTVLLNTLIGNSGCSPLWCMFCKKHRCWKQNWCHGDGTGPRSLETLRLASAWCTPADAGNMRTTSKEWYEAFEHTPDEITKARIEQKQMCPILDSIICSGRTRLVRIS